MREVSVKNIIYTFNAQQFKKRKIKYNEM